MDVAAMSTKISQANLQYQVSVSVLKKAMDGVKDHNEDLIKILEQNTKAMELSLQPYLGNNVDLKV